MARKKDPSREYSQAWGGRREGSGRPAGTTGAYKEVRKDESIFIRVTAEEKASLRKLAEEAGMSLSKYIHSRLF